VTNESIAARTAPTNMKTYYLGLLLRGPAYTTNMTPDVQQLHNAHLAHLFKLRDEGLIAYVGPLTDGGEKVGAAIYRTASRDEAVALMEADPAIQAGRFRYEIHTWVVPGGIG
jgi:uncharacterized protein YciI